jgi:hypothetical protein
MKYNIICNSTLEESHEIINVILKKHCGLHSYGFNRINDEYWGKNGDKLYFNLKITSFDKNISIITIHPIIGVKNEIEKLYNSVKEYVEIYEPGYATL